MEQRPERRHEATVALVLLTAMNLVNYLDRYILPAVQEQVKSEFHLTDAAIGALTFWFFIAYTGSSPLTGWLGDRFPRKPLIVTAAFAIAAMNFFTAGVHSYAALNVRHAALGVGEACFGVFAPALLAGYYSAADRNRVLMVFNIAIPVGAATGVLAGGAIGEHHGWRMAFILSAVPGALMALLILLLLREPKRVEDPAHAKTSLQDVAALFTNRAYLCAVMGYAAVTFSLGGISWWMISFLQRMNGLSQSAAGTMMGGITVVCGIGGTITGGTIAQRWSRTNPKALYWVPAIGALTAVPPALVSFFGPRALTVPSLALAVFLIFLGSGPVNAATLNAAPAQLRAAAMAGQLFALHVFGDMISPPLIGVVSDHSNLRVGLSVTLVTFVLASAIFAAGTRYAPRLDEAVAG